MILPTVTFKSVPSTCCSCKRKPGTWMHIHKMAFCCDKCVPRCAEEADEPIDGDYENDDPDNWVQATDAEGKPYPGHEWIPIIPTDTQHS